MNETIGDYRLIQKLGEGAAGEVFLATPIKDKVFAKIGQLVALKRYKTAFLQKARQFERIDREFEVGSTLSHPNLVRIFDYSNNMRGPDAPYLVLEYVDGVTLDKWIDQYHPIPSRLLLRFAEQLLRGVSNLHKADILHRDLKPENVMITSTFDVKIMDFGVVRPIYDSSITPEEMFLGTTRNSSPEMLFGKEYDKRTDLYSVGTIFYALLHGEQLFADVKQRAQLSKLVESEYPHFDSGIKTRDEVASTLLDITCRLIKKSPEDRYSNASEVLDLLKPIHAAAVNKDPLEPLHGYIATALTGLDTDARDAIIFTSSKIAQLSKEYGLYVYEPRKATDPLLHQDVDPTAVYRLDRKRVIAADMLFVIANRPSFGVGQEIEIASSCSTPIILLVREGAKVSRMVTGSPANIIEEIYYKTPEELERKLRKTLTLNLDKVRKWHSSVRSIATTHIGHKFVNLRREQGYDSITEFADKIGISPRLLEAFEQGEYQNIPLYLIEKLAISLGSSLSALLSPVSPHKLLMTSKNDSNIRLLENTAKKLRWDTSTFLELRDDYDRQLAASGEALKINPEQWVARKTALDNRHLKEPDDDSSKQKQLFEPNNDK